jgi:phosphoserine/homoserine phosphotransferase
VSVGDSFNDTTMLLEADKGFLFHAPGNVKAQFPQLEPLDDYSLLMTAIRRSIGA